MKLMLPFNPFIVIGLLMVGVYAGSRFSQEQFFIVLVFALILTAAVPAIAWGEAVLYRKEGRWAKAFGRRPKMTWLTMVVLNASEVLASIFGITFGYVLGH